MNPKIPSRPLSADDIGLNKRPNEPKKPVANATHQNSRPQSSQSQTNQAKAANRPARQNAPTQPNKPSKPGKQGNDQAKRERRGMPPQRRQFDRGGKRTMVEGSFNQTASASATTAKPVTAAVAKADAGVLKIIPLGGLDKIGKNMMALEYEQDIIIIDMGFMFPNENQPGVDYIIPDTTYLEQRKDKIRGILITHAHEDHVGGIPFMLPKLPAPIYGAKFTLHFIERKLEEYHLPFKPELREVDQDSGKPLQLGAFSVEFLRVTHSIPDACAIVIKTPVGTIINTGDWRFDDTPLDGKPTNKARLKQLGDEGVLMLMSDSTSCEKMGAPASEQEIKDTLRDIFVRNYNKRIIISSFASQVNRLQIFIDAAAAGKRKLALVGRSILSNLELAVKLGYIKVPPGVIIKAADIDKYQDGELVILATGHQGEENSALVRMGKGEMKDVKLKKSDVVVLSSSIIPGNENSVWDMVDNLFRQGPYVYQNDIREFDDLGIMHTSGHAAYEEVMEMIKLVRPKYYVPIHGEIHHMIHNGEIAKRSKIIEEKNVFVIENGQTLLATNNGVVKKGPIVQNGSILIDGNGVGDVQGVVLRDRIAMGSDGMLVVIATINRKSGKLVTSPDMISRGFVYMKDNEELLQKSRKIIKNIFETRDVSTPANSLIIKTRMRDELANYLYKVTKRNPIVLPVVIEV